MSISHSSYLGFYRLGSATGVCHGLASFSNLRLLFPILRQYLHFIHTSIFLHWTVANLRLIFPGKSGSTTWHIHSPPTRHFTNLTDIYSRSAGSLDVFKSAGTSKCCNFAWFLFYANFISKLDLTRTAFSNSLVCVRIKKLPIVASTLFFILGKDTGGQASGITDSNLFIT